MAYSKPHHDADYGVLRDQVYQLGQSFTLLQKNGSLIYTDTAQNSLLFQHIHDLYNKLPRDPSWDARGLCNMLHLFFEAMENPSKESCAKLSSVANNLQGAPDYVTQICVVLAIIAGLLLFVIPGLILNDVLRNTWRDSQRRGLSKAVDDVSADIKNAASISVFGVFSPAAPTANALLDISSAAAPNSSLT